MPVRKDSGPASSKREAQSAQGRTPDMLRPFASHGLRLDDRGGRQVAARCPFCGRGGKLGIVRETGQWRCVICDACGNIASFLQQLHAEGDRGTDSAALADLASQRSLLDPMTPNYWGAVQSPITGWWLAPGWNAAGKLTQLYRWIVPYDSKDGKRTLQPTAEVPVALFGANLYDPLKGQVHLCEGIWDAMVWWEMLRQVKRGADGTLQLTGSEESSLLSDISVLAVPGALTFRKDWAPLFSGKRVTLIYHSDGPRKVNGKEVGLVGFRGMRKVAEMLSQHAPPPKEIRCVMWGSDGYDPTKKSGYDLRDHLGQGKTEKERVVLVGEVIDKIAPIPAEWIAGRTAAEVNRGGLQLSLVKCKSWAEVVNACRKAVTFTEGLDRLMSVSLASVLSVKSNGEPLWFMVISPPSTGKTTIAEAVSANERYIYPLTSLTGIHSGWKTDSDGAKDHGLIPLIRDKTVIIKDADPLLEHPARAKILAELRDMYDGVCRVHYNNGIDRQSADIDTTVILNGTNKLRKLDSSDAGARFLYCVVMDGIDVKLEEEITTRSIYSAWNLAGSFANGTTESGDSPEITEMKQVTGGYVSYLRENGQRLVNEVTANMPPVALVQRLNDMATFAAYLRARPSHHQDEGDDREFAPRLSKQITRLAICLAVVLNKKQVDEEVMRRVRQTVLDTASGRTFEICRHLYDAYLQGKGVLKADLVLKCNSTEEKKSRMLRFLRRIGAAEPFYLVTVTPEGHKIKSPHVRWRMTERMRSLWESVVLNKGNK